MYATRRFKLIGLLYLTPALLFVLVFTAYPFVQMIWVSFHSWSLLSAPKFIELDNYIRLANDRQFWVSLTYSIKYTLLITPILMIGGFLIALLLAANTPLRRLTRTVVFIPVVIGLGVSSLLWYWLFSPQFGLINTFLTDIGLMDTPIIWLGTDESGRRGRSSPRSSGRSWASGCCSSWPPSRPSRRRSTRRPWSMAPARDSASVT